MSVPHRLSQEEAKSRISKLIADTRDKFGHQVSDVEESWTGHTDMFSFRAMGFSIDGRLDVALAEVSIDINVPWAALPFKGRIESEILKQAGQLLA